MNKLLLLLAIILLLKNVCGYNILVVFPYPGKSHSILGNGYVRHLLKAGHEVTYITARPVKPQNKLEQVDLSSTVEDFDLAIQDLNFETFLKQGNQFADLSVLYELMGSIANNSMTHENVQKFLLQSNKQFDLVIAEWLYSELYCGFAAIFNVPFIWSSSMEPHPEILKLIDEPLNPAYFPDHMSPVTAPLTFTERVSELWKLLNLYRIRWGRRNNDEKTFRNIFGPAAAKRGISLPMLQELKYKSSMVLGNSHVSSGDAHRLPQNYIPISGYHIEDKVSPLPEHLQKIMDNASNGVIYFSMGTMMKSKTMSLQFKRDLLKTFGELKQIVIWKLEEQLEDLPKNVYIVQWAPQQSVLAHPNCLLFITHGGLLSTTEALHFGVPIIGIPLFADQNINILRAVKKGYSLQVDLGYDTPAKLKVAIQEMISNSKYREKVKELSFAYHHRPTTPGAALVHWVEHVIQTKGAPHLQSPALHIPLYQKLYLDLIALVLIDEPLNPAYFPDHMSPVTALLTFTERVSELWKLLNLYRIRWGRINNDEKTFRNIFGSAAAKRGISLPMLQELKYKSSMVLGNSHVSSGDAHRLPQNYIPISGYHIEDKVSPLPEHLQKIMDNASNGVIYFSMGTMMKSKTMSLQFKRDLLKTFGELKQTVIWKLEEQLKDLPKNVYIVQWAPQQSVLAHPNCLLFITHGGLLSTTEALHFGVPIIGIPLFADQNINILRAVKKGYSLQVDLGYDTPAKLKVAIQEMISNSKYREKVKELSFAYHHRPTTPGAALVHWVEHVIQTKGAPHLQSPALHIPLYQKLYLDLIALVVTGSYILLQIGKLLIKLGKNKSSISHKKKNS